MRTTILIAVLFMLLSSVSGYAGGPGRNLRPGLTRSTQVTALSKNSPHDLVLPGAIQVFVAFSVCFAAVILTASLKIERRSAIGPRF